MPAAAGLGACSSTDSGGKGGLNPSADQTDATKVVTDANRKVLDSLPFNNTEDFADADRGFLRALQPGAVTAISQIELSRRTGRDTTRLGETPERPRRTRTGRERTFERWKAANGSHHR